MMTFIKNKQYILGTVGTLCATLVVIVASVMIAQPDVARGGEVWLGSAQVISPKPPAVRSYEAGSRIEFRVRYSYHYCANTMPSSRGRITQPVPYGQPHTGFGPERLSSITAGAATGGDAQHRYLFHSTYSQYFRAPLSPGTYWFKYRVGSRNGQGTDRFFEGVAVFKVDPIDRCTNITDVQLDVPPGYYETVDADGRRVCFEIADEDLICTVSQNPIDAGESVTFTARNATGENADFEWFEGVSTLGAPVKTTNNQPQSSYTTSFPDAGIYRVTAEARVNGNVKRCMIGVTVYPTAADDLADGDGTLLFLDPNAPPGEIDFQLGGSVTSGSGSLTNTTCPASWEARRVLGCNLLKNGEILEPIDLTGQRDITPGTYQISCLQIKDGTEIKSDPVICRRNPDFREI